MIYDYFLKLRSNYEPQISSAKNQRNVIRTDTLNMKSGFLAELLEVLGLQKNDANPW